MSDLIERQAAIDVEGLDEQIRCEMCRNPMHTNRGCDGNCKYDEKLYKRIMQILDERIKPLPSVQSEHKWETCFECPLSHGCPKIKGCTNEQAIEYASQIPNDCPLSAQHWVLCSEKLPEKQDEYQITWTTSASKKPAIGACEYEVYSEWDIVRGEFKGKWLLDDYIKAYPDVHVIAWKSLPDPYRGDGNE